MTAITIASIETTIGDVIHAAIARVSTWGAAIASVAATVDNTVNTVAPLATAVLAAVAPQDVAAAATAKTALNAIDAAVQAAGTSASGGVTVSLPAELVAEWQAMTAGLKAFEGSL